MAVIAKSGKEMCTAFVSVWLKNLASVCDCKRESINFLCQEKRSDAQLLLIAHSPLLLP